MKPKELDVVRLADGKEVTILEVYANGSDFYVEYTNPTTEESDFFMVSLSQIEKIVWTSK